LPQRVNGHAAEQGRNEEPLVDSLNSIDLFYVRVLEHAVAYFGSRVLYPARPAPDLEDVPQISRAACEKAAQAAARADEAKFDSSAQEWGYHMGCQIYDAYLAGKVAPRGLRRLFLAYLNQPGQARKVCTAVIARLRSVTRRAQTSS